MGAFGGFAPLGYHFRQNIKRTMNAKANPDTQEDFIMMMVILHYPAVAPTLAEVREDKEKSAAFFENEVPGLIDKTWGMNEEAGRMASVYHFEDKATADAWFNSEKQRSFRRANNASLEYFDVAALAYTKPLREEATA